MRFFIFLLGLCGQFTVSGQTYTLPMIESLVMQNYPLLKQSALLNQTAQLSVENIRKALYPQITLNGQATYQSDVTTISVPVPGFMPSILSKDQYRATVDIQQNIYDGGVQKSMNQLVQTGNTLALIKNEVDLYKVKERVTQLYCSILYTEAVIGQIDYINQDLKNALNKVEALHKNGLVFKNNVLQIKAQLLKNQQKLTEAQAAKKNILDGLAILINKNFETGAVFQTPDIIVQTEVRKEYERPEFKWYDAQKNNILSQHSMIVAKTQPKLGAFLQTGYGRPGLNMLKNEFALFGIGGLRLQWSLGSFYTAKKEKTILKNQAQMVENEKEVYALNNQIQIKQQLDEIEKLSLLIQSDQELIELREQIKQTSLVQLNNGVITANDYLKELNELDQARQLLVQHQVQMVQSKLQYQLIKGKSN